MDFHSAVGPSTSVVVERPPRSTTDNGANKTASRRSYSPLPIILAGSPLGQPRISDPDLLDDPSAYLEHRGASAVPPGLGDELARIIASGQRQGEIREVDAQQAGAVLAPAYFSTVLRWTAVEPAPFALLKHIEGVLEIVLGGILTGP